LREECRLRAFENRVLRRLFGPKRDAVTGEWRRLHTSSSVFLTRYLSGYQVKKNEMDRTCNTYGGEKRHIEGFFSGETRGKEPLGRPWRRWQDNIKMDLREVEWRDIYWISLSQGRDRWRALVNAVMNF
jgi:hypothetical protein